MITTFLEWPYFQFLQALLTWLNSIVYFYVKIVITKRSLFDKLFIFLHHVLKIHIKIELTLQRFETKLNHLIRLWILSNFINTSSVQSALTEILNESINHPSRQHMALIYGTLRFNKTGFRWSVLLRHQFSTIPEFSSCDML